MAEHPIPEKRVMTLPADLRAALAQDEPAQPSFAALPYSHQREYVVWIESAKKPETRAARIAKTIPRLVVSEKKS